jgi:hypothetical protein
LLSLKLRSFWPYVPLPHTVDLGDKVAKPESSPIRAGVGVRVRVRVKVRVRIGVAVDVRG